MTKKYIVVRNRWSEFSDEELSNMEDCFFNMAWGEFRDYSCDELFNEIYVERERRNKADD